jgi:hypothetical protein
MRNRRQQADVAIARRPVMSSEPRGVPSNRLPNQSFTADTPDRSERTMRVMPQFSLKSLLVACLVMAIVAAIAAPLARRISFGSGAIITWETDNGEINLVGVGPTLHGQVALVLLLTISALGLAFAVRRRRRAMRARREGGWPCSITLFPTLHLPRNRSGPTFRSSNASPASPRPAPNRVRKSSKAECLTFL